MTFSPRNPPAPTATSAVSDSAPRRVVIPNPVRAMVQAITMPSGEPEATDELRRFVDRLDPQTTPVTEELIDVILVWIATADPTDARLPAWADHVLKGAHQLHPKDHYRVRRTRLADTAVRAGILAARQRDGRPYQQIRDLMLCIACAEEPRPDRGTPTQYLSAYLLLHAYGHCDQAIHELALLLRSWQESFEEEAQPTMVVVLTAMLAACGRTHDTAEVLHRNADIIGVPGSRLRDLIALSAFTITDIITASHTPLCTSGQPALDRHTWSAMAYGENPDQHLCIPPARTTPPPVPDPADAGGPYDLDVTELPERLYNHFAYVPDTTPSNDLTGSAPARTPVGLWLACQDCRLAVLLGQSTLHDAVPDPPIAPVTIDGVPAWQDRLVSTAVRRMLQDHPGHRLCAVTDRSAHWTALTTTTTSLVGRAGGPDTISHADYVDGWPHHPRLADYRGATPQPVTGTHHDETPLLCTWCRLELMLGHDLDHADTANGTLVAAVMRLVTDHAGHGLLLADEDQLDNYYQRQGWADTIRVGADDPWVFGDVTLEQYLAGWPTNPGLPRYRGFNPSGPPPATPSRPVGVGYRRCCNS